MGLIYNYGASYTSPSVLKTTLQLPPSKLVRHHKKLGMVDYLQLVSQDRDEKKQANPSLYMILGEEIYWQTFFSHPGL